MFILTLLFNAEIALYADNIKRIITAKICILYKVKTDTE